jgi:hypothetical protein
MKTKILLSTIAIACLFSNSFAGVDDAYLSQSDRPAFLLDDTDYTDNDGLMKYYQWGLVTSVNSDSSVDEFALFDAKAYEGNDQDSSKAKTIRLQGGSNSYDSIVLDSAGNLSFGKGSLFVSRHANIYSKVKVGIGTNTPAAALHLKPTGLYLVGSAVNTEVRIESATNSSWGVQASSLDSLIQSYRQFQIRDQNASTTPFIINHGAPTNTLVIGNNDSNLSNVNSYVGIGVSNPTEKLDVFQAEDGARLILSTAGAGTYDAPQFTSRRAGSDGSGHPENTKNLDVIGSFAWRGHDGTDWTGAKALFWVRADGDWSDSSTGTSIEIRQTPKNSTTALTAIQIKNHADVYIPNGNLYVKGTKMNVPDYVFNKDYKLMPLNELKTFIEKNNHLPGVASADEVGKSGVVNLSGLQMTLLEKVEELTLYTLQQDEALKNKEKKIAKMEEKIRKLEAMQKRLAKVEALLTNLALETSHLKKEKLSLQTP